jgi:hypothetical protein
MEEAVSWGLVIVAVCIVLPFVFKPLAAILYWVGTTLGVVLFTLLDGLFGARLIPGAPWLMWLLWGALIGAAVGFWTVAPVYGLRKQRPLLLGTPFILMVLVALFAAGR